MGEFSGNVPYSMVQWEEQAFRVKDRKRDIVKESLSYDNSLVRLQRAGFTRHPQPSELFGFLISALENRLTADMDPDALAITSDGIQDIGDTIKKGNLFTDMQTDYGEWISAAWRVETRKTNLQILTHYSDPEGLVLVGKEYVAQQYFHYSHKQEFDVTGIPLQRWVPLNRFDESLQRHLYTCSFANLPREMRENDDPKNNAGLYLPSDNVIWPVGRRCHGRFAIGCHKTERASRGIHI